MFLITYVGVILLLLELNNRIFCSFLCVTLMTDTLDKLFYFYLLCFVFIDSIVYT